jgi:predicted double-glycine peptidase
MAALARYALVLAGALVVAAPGDSAAQVRTHGEGGGSFTVPVMSWRDIPFRSVVRQQYDYSCGSAAVATLLTYHYGAPVNEATVFRAMWEVGDQARIQEVGFSMLDMKTYLDNAGFGADGLRVDLNRLADAGVPAIALIVRDGYRHFVVIKGISETEVLLGDPTLGLRSTPRAEFEAQWNGIALVVRRPPAEAPAPLFNAPDDWGPWAAIDYDAARPPRTPQEIDLALSPLYQISPFQLQGISP